MCKLNIEKAYNHLNQDFLLHIMQKNEFWQEVVDWIRWSFLW